MRYFTFLLFCLTYIFSFSQDYSKYRIPCERIIYPIHYYHVLPPYFKIPKDTNSLNIQDLILDVNKIFKKTCIEFKLCMVDTIRDYNYYPVLDDPSIEQEDITSIHYDDDAINVYRVSDVITESYYGICWEKSKRPRIFLTYSDNSMISISTLNQFSRQMCRYFGLAYTNSSDTSKELVNTTNSLTTADSIWDTPADPFTLTPLSFPDTLSYPESLVPKLHYFYSNRKDSNKEYYNPMMLNLMSVNRNFFIDRCQDLTHEQYQRIIRNERMCRRRFQGLE